MLTNKTYFSYYLLHNIKKYQSFSKVGRELNIPRKSVAKKIKDFEKDDLIFLGRDGWEMTSKGKIIVGVDEAGSKLQNL
jgi:predicted transcriptional regulator